MAKPSLLESFDKVISEAIRENLAVFRLEIEEAERDKCHEQSSQSTAVRPTYSLVGDELERRLHDYQAKISDRKAEISYLSEARSNASRQFLALLSSQLTGASQQDPDFAKIRQALQKNDADIAALNLRLKDLPKVHSNNSGLFVDGEADSTNQHAKLAEDVTHLRTMVDNSRTLLAKMDGESTATHIFVEEMIAENGQRDALLQRHEENLGKLVAQNDAWKVKIDTITADVEKQFQTVHTLLQSLQEVNKNLRSQDTEVLDRLAILEESATGFKTRLTTTSLAMGDVERSAKACHDRLEAQLETLRSMQELTKNQLTVDETKRSIQDAVSKAIKNADDALAEAENRILHLEDEQIKLTTEHERLRVEHLALQKGLQGLNIHEKDGTALLNHLQPFEHPKDVFNATALPSAHYCLPVERYPAQGHRSVSLTRTLPHQPQDTEAPYKLSPCYVASIQEQNAQVHQPVTLLPSERERPATDPQPIIPAFGDHLRREPVELTPTEKSSSISRATLHADPSQHKIPPMRSLFPNHFRGLADLKSVRISGDAQVSDAAGQTNCIRKDVELAAHDMPLTPTIRVDECFGQTCGNALTGNPDSQDTLMAEVPEVNTQKSANGVTKPFNSVGGELPRTLGRPNEKSTVGKETSTPTAAMKSDVHPPIIAQQLTGELQSRTQVVGKDPRKRSRRCGPFDDSSDTDEEDGLPKRRKPTILDASADSMEPKNHDPTSQTKSRLQPISSVTDKSMDVAPKMLPSAKSDTLMSSDGHGESSKLNINPTKENNNKVQSSGEKIQAQNSMIPKSKRERLTSLPRCDAPGIMKSAAAILTKQPTDKHDKHTTKDRNDKAKEGAKQLGKVTAKDYTTQTAKDKTEENAKSSAPKEPKPEPYTDAAFGGAAWPTSSRDNPIELD